MMNFIFFVLVPLAMPFVAFNYSEDYGYLLYFVSFIYVLGIFGLPSIKLKGKVSNKTPRFYIKLVGHFVVLAMGFYYNTSALFNIIIMVFILVYIWAGYNNPE